MNRLPLRSWLERLGRSPSPGTATPIGLELGDETLRLVQMQRLLSRPTLRASVTLPYPGEGDALLDDPRRLRELVSRALRAGPFAGRRVVTALPAAGARLMVLNYPAGAGDDATQIVGLVRERIGGSLDDHVVDYLPIRTTSESRERSALVVVATREAVTAHLELLRRAGLEVVALEIAPVAVRRLVSCLASEESERNTVVVRCEDRLCELIVLWGRRLLLYREVDFSGRRLVELLRKGLDLEPEAAADVLGQVGVRGPAAGTIDPHSQDEVRRTVAEILRPTFVALGAELNDALVYTASRTRGASIDQVLLLGAFARWPGVDQLLGERVGVPVAVLDPLQALDPGQTLPRQVSAELAVATGLALRGVVDAD